MGKELPPESRRRFIRQSIRRLARWGADVSESAATAARSALGPRLAGVRPDEPTPVVKRPVGPIWLNRAPEMAYSRLGRTDFMVSRVVLGGGSLRLDRLDLIREAVDRGINSIDTALNYGESELALARALPELRDRIWIFSKMPPFRPIEAEGAAQRSPCAESAFWEFLDSTLARLGTDHLDGYLLQAIDEPWRLTDEALLASISRARQDGRIRHAGVSTHRNVKAVVEAALQAEVFDFMMLPVNPWTLNRMQPLLEKLRERDVGVLAMRVAAGLEFLPPQRRPPLHELPEALTARQLVQLYMLEFSSCPGFLIDVESRAQLAEAIGVAACQPSFIEMNELQAVVEQELQPNCAVCGELRPPSLKSFERAADRHFRRRLDAPYFEGEAGLGAGREASTGGSLFEAICERCEAARAPSCGEDEPPPGSERLAP